MEILKNKFLVKLIAVICLFLTLFNFAGTTKVYAAEDDNLGWGGVLINPIVNLMTAIGDSIMDILHDSIQAQKVTLLKISGTTDFWDAVATFFAVVVGIVAGLAFCLAVVLSAGAVAAAAAWLATGVATATFTVSLGVIAGGAVAGICAGTAFKKGLIPNDIYLPAFSISAEEIFKNQIHLFDVNFFNPKPTKIIEEKAGTTIENKFYAELSIYEEHVGDQRDPSKLIYGTGVVSDMEFEIEEMSQMIQQIYSCRETKTVSDIKEQLTISDRQKAFEYVIDTANKVFKENGWSEIKEQSQLHLSIEDYQLPDAFRKGTFWVSINKGSRENPILGEFAVVVNITYKEEAVELINTIKLTSTAQQLTGIVSTWYFILRNIALLVLMLLLIYSGIRIVIGSTAGEKAKYKERLMDWLVAMCLIFIMHYIMVFAVEIVNKITELVGNTVNGNAAYIMLTDQQYDNVKQEEVRKELERFGDVIIDEGEEGGPAIIWATDLAGMFRIKSQLTDEGTGKWVGYSFCYVVLVLFTLFFAFTYVRRVLYMAFLTMIAPLVAMTYPIDKITDGKAQAFDAWLKEYIFNLMIQPLHLLLYTILVTSAYTLASESPIYALVAVGFMMPAEKLMRRFFGYEKAKTPGLLGGAAGAALAMTGLQNLLKPTSSGGKGAGSGKSKDQNKVKFANKNTVDSMESVAGRKATPGANVGGETNSETRPPRIVNNPSGEESNQSGRNINSPRGGTNSNSSSSSSSRNGNTGRNQQYDSRLTQEQIDEMSAEGITPGDEEYDNWLRQYGITPEEQYDSRLTQDQIDEMRAEGIGPGDEEYENWLRQYGITPETESEPMHEEELPRIEDVPDQSSDNVEETGGSDSGSNDFQEDEPISNMRRIRSAVGAAILSSGKQLAVGALRGIHPMKWAGRLAAAATAGTAGLLLGVASGDPNKAFQYTTTGAVAGSALAKSLSGNELLDGEKIKDEAEMAYYGKDYKEHLIEKQKKAFQRDPSNINYIRQTLGKSEKEAREILDTTGVQCFNNGITDVADIATIHQLVKGKDKLSFNQAVAARNYAKKRLPSDPDQMKQDAIEKYKARWQEEYKLAGYGNDKQCEDLAEKSFDLAIKFNKAQSNLTKHPTAK